MERNKKVRVTLKADLGDWGENFKLMAVDVYNKNGNNIVATVNKIMDEYGRWTGTGYFEKDLEAGKDYYVLSKENGSAFTILNVEEI